LLALYHLDCTDKVFGDVHEACLPVAAVVDPPMFIGHSNDVLSSGNLPDLLNLAEVTSTPSIKNL
jgi:hypothetical protein